MTPLIRFFAVLITALAAVAGMAYADDGIAPKTPAGIPSALKGLQLEAGHGREQLDKSYYTDWLNTYVTAENRLDSGVVAYGTARQVERYRLTDQEYLLGSYLPVAERTFLLVEGNMSPAYNVLPRWSALLELNHSFDGGWGGGIGARRTEYAMTQFWMGIARIERYLGPWYGSYTLRQVSVDTIGDASSHSLKLSCYYGDKSFAGAGYSIGRELESAGAAGTLVSDITEYLIAGRHWISEQWGMSWEAGSHMQGAYYTRRWISIGIRREF